MSAKVRHMLIYIYDVLRMEQAKVSKEWVNLEALKDI